MDAFHSGPCVTPFFDWLHVRVHPRRPEGLERLGAARRRLWRGGAGDGARDAGRRLAQPDVLGYLEAGLCTKPGAPC